MGGSGNSKCTCGGCHSNTYSYDGVSLLDLQMIELSIDSSGEVEITSKPKSSESKVATIGNIISSSEDDTKITELRNTIESLKAQIKASAVPF